jgi:hypothetical protein
MLGKEIYVLCAGGGEVAMEGEFSLGNRPQRHSRITRPIPVTSVTTHRPPAMAVAMGPGIADHGLTAVIADNGCVTLSRNGASSFCRLPTINDQSRCRFPRLCGSAK